MKIFLDSANLDEIKDAASTGLIDGVTTNPSLVSKGDVPFEELLKQICELVNGPISAEVLSTEHQEMVEEGRKLAKIHENIVVKVPLTTEGLKATQIFSQEGIHTNVTLCFSPTQALLAAKSGATFVSPFVGRLDDIKEDGMGLIQEILEVYSNYAYQTEVLVASVRHLDHVKTSALLGADVATIPYKVFTQLIHHPLTDKGLERFLEDWKSWKASKA